MVYPLSQYIPQKKLAAFCRSNHILKLAVFGSAIKGSLRPDSDIDILVEFEEGYTPGFISFCRMQNELTDIIGRQVDLRTPEDLSRYFREDVVRTAEVHYEGR